MSRLTVYAEHDPATILLRSEEPEVISASLKQVGVRFERWASPAELSPDDDAQTILDAFRPHLDNLMGECGAGTADVIRLRGATEAYPAMRKKFIDEHTHTEDEIRFFVHGSGNFVLHLNGNVYDAHCTQGDLISVPAGTPHWFDAGPEPFCTVLRVFTDMTGWTPHYTGENISALFPVS